MITEATLRHEPRCADAARVFSAGWAGSPDRALLADCTTWTVVAANPAARDELIERHGIDLVGLDIRPLVADAIDLESRRVQWRDRRDAEVTVRPHAYDPNRFVRIEMWALGGFDGDYLVVVARDVDLGFRSAFETTQPLFEVSNNLVALASGSAIVYSNPRFVAQFGRFDSLDEFVDRDITEDFRADVRRAVERARSGHPGLAFEVRFQTGSDTSARGELAVAPAPNLADRGVLIVIVPLGPDDVELPDALTAREREIVTLVLQGLRIPSIARDLHLSPHTVRNHLRTIFAKCDVSSQRELVDRLRNP
jgi:DNA-binding CsgD family transcriptional regulator